MVHDAARGADDDLGAGLKTGVLAFVGLAAVNREGVDAAFEEGKFVDFFSNLNGEFAGWAEDDGLDGAEVWIDFFDGRDGEGGGFAGAGLGLADDVAAGEERGDGFGLDGRSFFEAELVDGFQKFG